MGDIFSMNQSSSFRRRDPQLSNARVGPGLGALARLAGPIAIVANVFRILVLCVVGYFWGSAVAFGTFHDVSGFFIYGVAFILFFLLEAGLRKLAPARTAEEGAQ